MRRTAFQCEALRSGAGLETAFHILQCATFSDRHDREVSSRATRRLAKYLVRVEFRRSDTNLFLYWTLYRQSVQTVWGGLFTGDVSTSKTPSQSAFEDGCE